MDDKGAAQGPRPISEERRGWEADHTWPETDLPVRRDGGGLCLAAGRVVSTPGVQGYGRQAAGACSGSQHLCLWEVQGSSAVAEVLVG